jgi:hypothetical protein
MAAAAITPRASAQARMRSNFVRLMLTVLASAIGFRLLPSAAHARRLVVDTAMRLQNAQ